MLDKSHEGCPETVGPHSAWTIGDSETWSPDDRLGWIVPWR
jgi:hypothetical protein